MRYLLLATLSMLAAVAIAADRPNFIIIFTDDHGYADLSAQGVLPDIRTPHIDALAAGGVRMTSGYSSAPQCVPSRAGVLTGKYQNRFGVESNKETLEGFNEQQTIAERLKAVGYATGMIGKWHLGPASEITTHGFDDVFYQGGSWTNFDFQGNDVAPGTKNGQLYHLDAGGAAAKAFIKRHREEPFFLYLAYRAPHVPLDATKKYLDRFPGKMPERRRQALAMLSAVDDGVGGVIDSLREHGIEENTLIFFIGDNGAPLKIHKLDAPGGGPGWDGSLNDPMNGEKGMLSEGGVRVPFVVYWKDRIAGGQTYDDPVISLDAAGTILPLSGVTGGGPIDGVNLLPHLTGQNAKPPHDHLYWRWISQSAVRKDNWKLLRGGEREYLFDLNKDKEEKHNVLDEHPEIAKSLRSRLRSWSQTLQPPGLKTGEMSVVWDQYYDFYLDGKPAPPLRPKATTAQNEKSSFGWVVRNGRAEPTADGLRLRADAKAKGRLFIARSGFDLQGPLYLDIALRTPEAGELSVAWRKANQKDFPRGQSVGIKCDGAKQMNEYRLAIRSDAKVIHLRITPPTGQTDIKSITICDKNAKPLQRMSFGK